MASNSKEPWTKFIARCDCNGEHFVSISGDPEWGYYLSVETYEDSRKWRWRSRAKLMWEIFRGKGHRLNWTEIILNTETTTQLRDVCNEVLERLEKANDNS